MRRCSASMSGPTSRWRLCRARARRSTGRVLDVLIDRRPDVGSWPLDAKLISAQSEPDGGFAVRIDAHAEAGYRLSGPRYGAHILSPGRATAALPARGDRAGGVAAVPDRPGAAVRRGASRSGGAARERRHRRRAGPWRCSAPPAPGRPRSRSRCAARGARFLADDVLALERCEGALLAHPGTPAAGVARAEAARLGRRSAPAGVLAVNERERLIRVAPRP